MNAAFRIKLPLHLQAIGSSLAQKNPRCLSSAALQSVSLEPLLNPVKNPVDSKKSIPDYEYTIISALKYCSSSLFISQGQQFHCVAVKSGLLANIFIQNSLITFYVKCGLIANAKEIFDEADKLDCVSCNIMISGYVRFGYLNDARVLFDKMPEKNCVSYTTMILGLVKNELWSEAIRVFCHMNTSGVSPSEVTMASLMSAYMQISRSSIELWRMLHGFVLKVGLLGFVIVSTNLIHMYCLSSCLSDAEMLFGEIPQKNTVTWNVMLNGYAKAGLVDLAMELFQRIADKDVVSWGTVIDGYLRDGRLNEALKLYCQMLRTGLSPNDVMFVDIMSSCAQAKAFNEGLQFHAVASKKGLDHYVFVQSTMIHFYAACREINLAHLQFKLSSKEHPANWNALIAGLIRNGMIDEARALFNGMPEKDIFSWSSMIAGYSQKEQPQPELALELFHEMVKIGFRPNEITMVSVLSAIATLGCLNKARQVHDYICNNSIRLNDNLSAALIDMYAKCGSISTALEIFNQVQDKASDVSPWNAMICGSAMHGHAELALRIFSNLQGRNIKLNSITFIGVLSACCHAGLVEVGQEHFKSMKSLYNVEPNIKHYGCMVDLLGRAGKLKEAEELIKNMPMEADVVIWGTLLAASRTYGDTEIGERVAHNLARLEPCHGPSRVLLSNIYAEAERWVDAFHVRQVMHNQGLSRSPAYSGII